MAGACQSCKALVSDQHHHVLPCLTVTDEATTLTASLCTGNLFAGAYDENDHADMDPATAALMSRWCTYSAYTVGAIITNMMQV